MRKAALLSIPFALLAFIVSADLPGRSQQTPEKRTWTTQNTKSVELTAVGVHLSTSPAQGSSRVVTNLHLPSSRPWKVAFDVQMGPTLAGSMSVHLRQGKTDVAWLGADSYYKSLSAFLGSGTSNMPLSQHYDTEWHHFTYVNDGTTLSLWHNGIKCGEKNSSETPDTLEIGNNGQELRVTNVDIEALAASSSAAMNGNSAIAVKPLEVVSGSISYQMSQLLLPVVGMVSQVAGVWQVSVVIRNRSTKKVWLIPYCLLFDNGSREVLYSSDGWRLIHDERTIVVPSALGDGFTPTINMQATYITPTVDPVPTISIEPSMMQVVDVYAENAGGWAYTTTVRRDGSILSSSSGSQQVNRTPKFAIFLQVPAPIQATSVPIIRADRLMSIYSPDLLQPYKQFTTAINTVPVPAKEDTRWVTVAFK